MAAAAEQRAESSGSILLRYRQLAAVCCTSLHDIHSICPARTTKPTTHPLFAHITHIPSSSTHIMKIFGQEKIFGMDVLVLKNQVMALVMNVYAWIISTFVPIALQPKYAVPPSGSTCCVSIQGPGGLDQV